jgi:hypothetical protein
MRIALIVLFVVHGALHLLGFLKAWGLAALPQMNGRTIILLGAPATRVVGTLWLLAAAVLLIAAALHIAARESWWIAGAVGLLLSQALIILAWPDAKFGTVANVFILIAVLSAGATARFDRKVAEERATLLADVVTMPGAAVDAEALVDLPAPVRRWLSHAGVVGRLRSSRVRLAQSGELRTTPDGPWMSITAEQDFSVEPPGFVWQVRTTMLRVLPIVGRDRYHRGVGSMLITAAGLYPFVDASGPADRPGRAPALPRRDRMVPLRRLITEDPLESDRRRYRPRHPRRRRRGRLRRVPLRRSRPLSSPSRPSAPTATRSADVSAGSSPPANGAATPTSRSPSAARSSGASPRATSRTSAGRSTIFSSSREAPAHGRESQTPSKASTSTSSTKPSAK